MYQKIDHIIEKYWAGESSLEEESLIAAYLESDELKDGHKDLIPLFAFSQTSAELSIPTPIDVSKVISMAEAHNFNIDEILEKYWTGESSLQEEQALRRYVLSDEVSETHRFLVPIFSYYHSEKKIKALKELHGGELVKQESKTIQLNPAQKSAPEKQAPKVRRLFPRVATVAATVTALLMATFMIFQNPADNSRTYVNANEADEALEVTMEALAFLSNKYEKGSAPMKHIKQLEKTNVFNFK